MGQTEERALIGAILTDNDRIDDVQTFITSEMFTDEICSMLYNLVIRSYRDGNEVDGVTLASKVKSEIYPQEIVSRTISECILDCTTSVMAEEYAKCIYKDYLVRRSGDLVNKFRPDNTNVAEELQKLVEELEGLQLVTTHKDLTRIENRVVRLGLMISIWRFLVWILGMFASSVLDLRLVSLRCQSK